MINLLTLLLALNTSPVSLVGDSIMLDVAPTLSKQLNVKNTDAVVSRQAIPTLDAVQKLIAGDTLTPVVVLDLGNNGTVEETTLRTILQYLRPCIRVVVINSAVNRPWRLSDDALLSRVVPQYKNARLADWYTVSKNHPEYFRSDDVHLSPKGVKVYSDLVVKSINEK